VTRARAAAGIGIAACAALTLAGSAAAQWSALGLSGRYVHRLRAADGFLYACTDDGLYRRERGSPDTTWALLGFAGGRVNDVLPASPLELVACQRLRVQPADSVSLWRTTDGGAKWSAYQNGYGRPSDRQVESLRALPDLPQVWLATGSGIEKSTDSGQSWATVADECVARFVDIAPHADPVLWAGGETCIFSAFMLRSTNQGETWTRSDLAIQGGGDNSCYATAFHPTDPDFVLVGGEGRVFRTTDGGTTWDNATSPNPALYLFGMASRAFPPLRVYAGGAGFPPQNVVLYRSDDAGLSWQPLTHPADAGYGVTGLLVDSQPSADTIDVATANGVYRYVETELVGAPPFAGASPGLTIRPNPLGRQATILFHLDRPGRARLEVIGVDGRRIATLLDGERAAGPQAVTWDATPIPSGLYFAVLRTAGRTASRRVVRLE